VYNHSLLHSFLGILVWVLFGCFGSADLGAADLKQQSFKQVSSDSSKALKQSGPRAKMFFNKASKVMDSKAYSQFKLPSGETVLWNKTGKSSYQIQGKDGRIYHRTQVNSGPRMQKIRLGGSGDVATFAAHQGKLTEARTKIDLSKAQMKGLELKSQAGLASHRDLKTLKNLKKNIPRFEKAYRGLEKQVRLPRAPKTNSPGLKTKIKGGIRSTMFVAGVTLLSDAIAKGGIEDLGDLVRNASDGVMQPRFWQGFGGGIIGGSLLAAIPIPGMGGILKAVPAFVGSAIGFELGANTWKQADWPQILVNRTVQALAWAALGGGIVGLMGAVAVGAVTDHLFEGNMAEGMGALPSYEPDWERLALAPRGASAVPGPAPFLAPIPVDVPKVQPSPTGAKLGSSLVPVAPRKPQTEVVSAENSEISGDLETWVEKMKEHYESYVKKIQERDAVGAQAQYTLYKETLTKVQTLRARSLKHSKE
jgi:hypothetical protein